MPPWFRPRLTVEKASLDLKYTKVLATIDGRMSKATISEGNLVVADKTLLSTIVSEKEMYVEFYIDEQTVLNVQQQIREGRIKTSDDKSVPVAIRLGNETSYSHEGQLNFFDNALNSHTGTYLLRAVFENPKPAVGSRLLLPGMSVDVRLAVGMPETALLVADRAIGSDLDQKYVYVLNDKDQPEKRMVELGTMFNGLRVVKKGLAAGDQVIVVGQQNVVRPNITIKKKTKKMTDYVAPSGEPTDASGAKPSAAKPQAEPQAGKPTGSPASNMLTQRRRRENSRRVFPILHRPADFCRRALDCAHGRRDRGHAHATLAQYPEIAPPTVQVSCVYPGANAEVVAKTVAAVIEQQVNGVEHMLYMSSQCTNDGAYNLTVTFKLGTNLDMAQVLVQNRVNLAVPSLPDIVKQTGVTTKKKSPNIMLVVNLYSPGKQYKQLYLSNYASVYIKDDLARLEGVGDVSFLGQQDYSMRAWLDPVKMAGEDLTAGDVIAALAGAERAGRRRPDRPAAGAQRTGVSVHMSALGRLTDAERVQERSSSGRATKSRS